MVNERYLKGSVLQVSQERCVVSERFSSLYIWIFGQQLSSKERKLWSCNNKGELIDIVSYVANVFIKWFFSDFFLTHVEFLFVCNLPLAFLAQALTKHNRNSSCQPTDHKRDFNQVKYCNAQAILLFDKLSNDRSQQSYMHMLIFCEGIGQPCKMEW